MKVINISVRNKIAKNIRESVYEYVCGNSDYSIEFDFDEEWNAFEVKTARFKFNDTFLDVVFEGNVVNIPVIENAHMVQVGVFAGNLHTTTPAVFMSKKSILCGSGIPAAPSDDVYIQIIELLNKGGVANGVPAGGKTGQFLRKKSDSSFDVEWRELETDNSLILKDGVLSVNTTDQMGQDNTLPMSAAGVFATVGNIEALLKTI